VLRKALIAAAIVAPLIAVSAVAQQSGIKRTRLQNVDFPAGYTVVSGIAEIAPGHCAGRHTHPGVEVTYVMEGAAVLFEVILGENLDRGALVGKLNEFVQRLTPGDTAFFFFSGHGVALDGVNYILPADVPDITAGQERA
jgi:hypothetical protein